MSVDEPRLLLVGWEVADWQLLHPLIDKGELPVLEQLVNTGSSGTIFAPPPPVTAAQWTTIATGKRSWQHRIHVAHQGTLPHLAPVDAEHRTSLTLWEILTSQGHSTVSVGWPATHGSSTSGVVVSDRFHLPTGPPGQPWPPALQGTTTPDKLAHRLDPLRVQPESIDQALIAQYVPDWQQIDQSRDPRLSRLCMAVASDFSYHAAATELLSSEPWTFATVRFPGIGAICQLFARHYLLANNAAAKTEELYQNVLPMAFRTLDAMLGRLQQVAGPDTAIALVSPNGLALTLDPSQAAWKQSGGIFIAAGKGFAKDILVHGMNALDITPTLLSWYQLPTASDMEGRPHRECLTSFDLTNPCPTYEKTCAGDRDDATTLRETLSTVDAWTHDWNHVQSLLNAGRVAPAIPLLTDLFRENPENLLFSETLFQSQLAEGLTEQAEETLEVLLDYLPAALTPLPRAELALAKGQREQARQLCNQLLQHPPESSQVWYRIGLLLMALREWQKLETCARTVLQRSQDEEIAWLGLAEALLRRHDYTEAEEAAQRAIGLQFYLPDAHFALSRALAGQGKVLAATQALERLLQIDPTNKAAAVYLRRFRG